VTEPRVVLIVDDFDDNREMFAEYLEVVGFRVLQASSGGEAVELAIRERPSVVLMDVTLPDIDGWEATRRIKADPRGAPVPIIALTGRSHDEAAPQARAAGCASLLVKPCAPEAVVAEIERVLAKVSRT
jgi:two-component system, cell cycle response regulator DivK